MAVIKELIRVDENETISFGNYLSDTKQKLSNFEFEGDIYKVKTYKDITKLEKNGLFVYESVPGTSVHQFKATYDEVYFNVEAPKDAQITLELEAEKEYEININHKKAGNMKTNLGGKLSLSVELENEESVFIHIVKL